MPALVPAAVPATASINPWTCDGVTIQRIPNPTLQAVPPAEAERSSDWSTEDGVGVAQILPLWLADFEAGTETQF